MYAYDAYSLVLAGVYQSATGARISSTGHGGGTPHGTHVNTVLCFVFPYREFPYLQEKGGRLSIYEMLLK